ncbi:peptide-methionine (S)-S-oxide reductase [Candidatus Kaiserbacteria bacterium RIFCSPHIGHO2_01_FULL_54_36]|uniref:Peptide methionine sulfoxide reductase MsrA n=1 Tax=Candidatus Kaiserbacteria bacterium RIFCSPHIGHO2_01_FULL_54_36 TaxID=1798482 RepID=A0A1F6CNL6_9BACT|nr:MAG: peptide-methionine (S)-S-oxide reductase [Candidatus Kaiserbacteria bacterium RIFCSPHIGHO2_01_FULL_54_36]OGG75494.1 MAG: peptide-methionine (S)-S-oxide reductase [Candidatus Kaiserbacteria bacterium RIFCSPLOWO2_01_FULL_54_22]
MATAIFGGGCFWCTEAVFQMLKGVEKVESGYAGGSTSSPQAAPTYEQVSSGTTGHAEVIRVTYDPAVISYEDLLTVFFGSHDPTTPNRQGADVGEQYRSVIFYSDEQERQEAEAKIKEIQDSLTDGTRVVTQVVPLEKFFPAESYHQNYYKSNTSAPYCQLIIEPKIEKVRKRFSELVKQ